MIENEIRKIISNYKGLSYIDVEDSGEGKLFGVSVDYVDTRKFNEFQYEDFTDLLEEVDVIKPTFQIYCSYDRSGYDFWTEIMEESNYTYIDICIVRLFHNFTPIVITRSIVRVIDLECRFNYINLIKQVSKILILKLIKLSCINIIY